MTVVVAGIGNPLRHDDGVGRLVAAGAVLDGLTHDVGPVEDPLDLLGRWDGAGLAVIIDAMRTGLPPGTVRVIDLDDSRSRQPGGGAGASTHTIGLIGAWRLARATATAPDRAVVVGVEGEDFGWGIGLSPAVRAAVPVAVRQVTELIGRARSCV